MLSLISLAPTQRTISKEKMLKNKQELTFVIASDDLDNFNNKIYYIMWICVESKLCYFNDLFGLSEHDCSW